MSKKDQINPAFPTPSGCGNGMFSGISERDYFAAKAMLGILNTWTEFVRFAASEADKDTDSRIDHLAKRSYDIADAMLKARET